MGETIENHIYRGLIVEDKNGAVRHVITVDDREIDPARSQKLVNHSPDGFNWGYGGSGPAQAALAILLEEFDDEELALAEYQRFKGVLACYGTDLSWEMDSEAIRNWFGNDLPRKHLRP